MAIVEFLGENLVRLHEELDRAVRDLSPQQLHWRPGEGCNHIGFALWHLARTEDNVVHLVLQRKTPLWVEHGWDKRFGLDPRSQGTGMPAADAAALRVNDLAAFREYLTEVGKGVSAYLATLTDDDLARTARIRISGPVEERPLRRILAEQVLTHGFSHLGEMWTLRGLMGFKGAPF